MIATPMSILGLAHPLAFLLSTVPATPLADEPRAKAADGPAVSRQAVRLHVVTDVGQPDSSFDDVVRDAVARKLRSHGMVTRDAASTTLTVEVSRAARGGYDVQYGVETPGRPVERKTHTCERCGSDVLVDEIVRDLEDVLPALEAAQKPNPPSLAMVRPAAELEPIEPPKRRRIGPLGISGAVALGVGVALVIPGAVLAATPDKVDNTMEYDVIRTSTPGYVLVGIGAAVVVTGAVLLGVDLSRRSKPSRRSSRVRLAPLALALRW